MAQIFATAHVHGPYTQTEKAIIEPVGRIVRQDKHRLEHARAHTSSQLEGYDHVAFNLVAPTSCAEAIQRNREQLTSSGL